MGQIKGLHKEVWVEIVSTGVTEVIKQIILALTAFITSIFTSQIIVEQFKLMYPFRLFIGCTFGLLGLWVFIVLVQFYYRDRPKFPRINYDFRIMDKEISYKYLDHNKMVFKKRYKLKAVKKDLKKYEDRYRWSGKGEITPKCLIEDHSFVKTDNQSLWDFFEINFNRHLSKGETIELGFNGSLKISIKPRNHLYQLPLMSRHTI